MIPADLANVLARRKKFVEDEGEVLSAEGHGAAGEVRTSTFRFSAREYAPKSEAGYVGLVNQGATCYLNSLLQTLFMMKEFRLALYCWEFNESYHGEESKCVPRQLQLLFSNLQLSSRSSVSTAPLTKSFGWLGSEAFVQQDVQECMSVIFSFLESTCKETPLAQHIQDMHSGTIHDFLQCLACGSARGRTEVFRDLSLKVRDLASLDESMRDFVKVETIEDVHCDACGKRAPHAKGAQLKKLPYFLPLQLKRFDFDFNTFARVKLGSKLEFPFTLDMARYLDPNDVEEDSNLEYELLSVMVHVGGALAGHYFAYIRESSMGRWLQFNDSEVSVMTSEHLQAAFESQGVEAAVQAQEGASGVTSSGNRPSIANSFTNAYMLLYRRKHSEKNLHEVGEEHIPESIRNQIAGENADFLRKKAEWEEEQRHVRVGVTHMEKSWTVRVERSMTVQELTKKLIQAGNLPELDPFLVRLRIFDSIKGVLLGPLSENPEQPLTEIDDHILTKPLRMEIRKFGEDFEDYLADGIALLISKFNSNCSGFEDPIQLKISKDASSAQLHELVRSKLDVCASTPISLALMGQDEVQIVPDFGDISNSSLGISTGDQIYVKIGEEGMSLMDYFSNNIISLNFNNPRLAAESGNDGDVLPSPPTSSLEVKMDQRAPLTQLKNTIGERLSLPCNEFKLMKDKGGVEIKDLEHSLLAAALCDGASIHIELGTPLRLGEYEIDVKYQEEVSSSPKDLGKMVVDSSCTISSLKTQMRSQFSILPEVERMRLRTCNVTSENKVKVEGVMVDSKTIKECYKGLHDGSVVCVQKTEVQENFTENHILLCIQRWFPEKRELGDLQEIALLDNTTFAEFVGIIETLSHVEKTWIKLVKPWSWQMKDVSNIAEMKWHQQPGAQQTLTGPPFRLQNGDLVLYKDGREKGDLDAAAQALKAKEAEEANIAESRDAIGFRIYNSND